jgi:hypothetical protein
MRWMGGGRRKQRAKSVCGGYRVPHVWRRASTGIWRMCFGRDWRVQQGVVRQNRTEEGKGKAEEVLWVS